eukprot:764477-Hanusia_phi.AAC.3
MLDGHSPEEEEFVETDRQLEDLCSSNAGEDDTQNVLFLSCVMVLGLASAAVGARALSADHTLTVLSFEIRRPPIEAHFIEQDRQGRALRSSSSFRKGTTITIFSYIISGRSSKRLDDVMLAICLALKACPSGRVEGE